jgi:chromosome segregation ATPase
MKPKIIIIVLAVVAVVLAIVLIAVKTQDNDQLTAASNSMTQFSNDLSSANTKILELNQVNLKLTNDLSLSQQEVAQLTTVLINTSNSLSAAANSLAATTSTLNNTKTSLQTAEDQVSNLNGRINDLESQNKVLDDKAAQLNAKIAELNGQIADTMKKLSESQTNNAFLTAELQKQLALKAELERKFNNLDEVRAQVKKLRDEAFVARRLQLMKNSATERKGAELLIRRESQTNAASAKVPPHYDLNVEVGSDGSVRVIPPIQPVNGSQPTNAPAH